MHMQATLCIPPSPMNVCGPSSVFESQFVLVDGLNLIRLDGKNNPQLTTLLSIVVELVSRAKDFMCVFDANTWFVLGGPQGTPESIAYKRLLQQFDEFFIECTGGTTADDIILAEAQDRDGVIICRDRYHDHVAQFPWIRFPKRLWLVNRVRDKLRIGPECYLIRRDLNGVFAELQNSLLKFRNQARKSA